MREITRMVAATLCLHCCKADVVLKIQCGVVVALERLEVNNKIILDSEYRVILKIFRVLVKDLCNQWRVLVIASLQMSAYANKETHPQCTYHDVNMSGSVRVTVQQLQQLPCRA